MNTTKGCKESKIPGYQSNLRPLDQVNKIKEHKGKSKLIRFFDSSNSNNILKDNSNNDKLTNSQQNNVIQGKTIQSQQELNRPQEFGSGDHIAKVSPIRRNDSSTKNSSPVGSGLNFKLKNVLKFSSPNSVHPNPITQYNPITTTTTTSSNTIDTTVNNITTTTTIATSMSTAATGLTAQSINSIDGSSVTKSTINNNNNNNKGLTKQSPSKKDSRLAELFRPRKISAKLSYPSESTNTMLNRQAPMTMVQDKQANIAPPLSGQIHNNSNNNNMNNNNIQQPSLNLLEFNGMSQVQKGSSVNELKIPQSRTRFSNYAHLIPMAATTGASIATPLSAPSSPSRSVGKYSGSPMRLGSGGHLAGDSIRSNYVNLKYPQSSLLKSAFNNDSNDDAYRLRLELIRAKEHIENLNIQLTSNVEMMSNFEQSLNSMRCRMNETTAHALQKDHEILALVKTINKLQNNGTRNISRSITDLNTSDTSDKNSIIDHTPNESPSKHISAGAATLSAPSTPKFMMKKIPEGDDQCEDELNADHTLTMIVSDQNVQYLKRALQEKERLLTDLKLELLSTEEKMSELKENTYFLSDELAHIREENRRLTSILEKTTVNVTTPVSTMLGTMDSSESSNFSGNSLENLGYSKRVCVRLGTGRCSSVSEPIAYLNLLTTTTWNQLDELIRAKFESYLALLDDNSGLELSGRDIRAYECGANEITRYLATFGSVPVPELLPYGYLVGSANITILLNDPLDYVVLDTCIPKSVLFSLLETLRNKRKLIIISSKGTGKSYLARCLARYILAGDEPTIVNIEKATIISSANVTDPTSDQSSSGCSSVSSSSPTCVSFIPGDENVHQILCNFRDILIIMDNIELLEDPVRVLDPFRVDSPFVICTGNCRIDSDNIRSLSSSSGFVIYDWNENMPKNLIGCILRKKMTTIELKPILGSYKQDGATMRRIIDWLNLIWNELNEMICYERTAHISIEPFLYCPMDAQQARIWFNDLWNLIILPTLRSLSDTQKGSEKQRYFIDWVHNNHPWIGQHSINQSSSSTSTKQCNNLNRQSSFLDTLIKLQNVSG